MEQINKELLPDVKHVDFRIGDTVRVYVRVKEGNKERVQPFQGICIGKKDGTTDRSFRIRKVSGGIGIERVFPYYSPMIERVELVQPGKVRRAKLYYLRERIGKKATKIKLGTRDLKKNS
jgi:large subunit ribosomal protein L19